MTAADTLRDIDVKRCPECGARFGIDAAFCPFDGVSLASSTWDPWKDRLVGSVVDQRYEVVAPLGEGGMGSVYKVRHVNLDRLFAMKVLRADLAADAELAARFVQEARTTAAIKHPAVVAITDFGELADRTPYYVMEMLTGETLAARLRRQGAMPPESAAKVARAIAEGLAASHAAGVVHRDLKPENVFLVGGSLGRAPEDDIRIVDFGAAKVIGRSTVTRPGIVFGTPHYMSPEQAGGGHVDGRADLYALGIVLFELLTGVVPFEADTYMGVLTKHMFAPPPKPSERVAAGVQLGALEGVVLRALEKQPSARFANASEMSMAIAGALRLFERRANVPYTLASARDHELVLSDMSGAERIQRSVSLHERDERDRRRRALVVALVGAIALLGVTSFVVSFLRVPVSTRPTDSASRASSATPTGGLGTQGAALRVGPIAPAREPSIPPPEPALAAPSPAPSASPRPIDGQASTENPASSAVVLRAPAATASVAGKPRGTTSGAAGGSGGTSAGSSTSSPSPLSSPDDFTDPWSRRAR